MHITWVELIVANSMIVFSLFTSSHCNVLIVFFLSIDNVHTSREKRKYEGHQQPLQLLLIPFANKILSSFNGSIYSFQYFFFPISIYVSIVQSYAMTSFVPSLCLNKMMKPKNWPLSISPKLQILFNERTAFVHCRLGPNSKLKIFVQHSYRLKEVWLG